MVKNIKKYKINKNLSYKLTFVALASSLIMSGCNVNTNDSNYIEYSDNIFSSEIDSNYTQYDYNSYSYDNTNEHDTPLITVSEKEENYPRVKLSNSTYTEYSKYIDSVEVNYDYASLYHIDEALEKDSQFKPAQTHSVKLNNINGDELYKIVLENNNNYLSSHTTPYQGFDKKELKKICKKIADVVNSQLGKTNNINETEIKCTLSDLKIFYSNFAFCNGYISEDENCLILSPTMIEIAMSLDEDTDMYDIVAHETMHLMQKECPDVDNLNPDLKYKYGFSVAYNDLTVNSLSYMWLAEASAEKSMSEYENQDPMTYANMINYMESLGMVNILNSNYRPQYLIYNDDINELYKYFNVTSEKDKREILNMMYSIEIMQQKPDDFYQTLNQWLGYEYDKSGVNGLDYNLRESVCRTFNKYYYRNLAKTISEKDIPLNDVFYLISVYEMDLNNHILYNDYNQYEANDILMKEYVEMQDELFKMIAKDNNMTYEEILELYDNYNSQYYQAEYVCNNYDLSWLDSDKIDYMNQRQVDLSRYKTVQLRDSYNDFSSQKSK